MFNLSFKQDVPPKSNFVLVLISGRKRTEAETIRSQNFHQMNLIYCSLAIFFISCADGFIPRLHQTAYDSSNVVLLGLSKKNDSVDPLISVTESNTKPHSIHELHNPVLDQAITNANLMSKTFGVSSREARLAWEKVEDIAASDMPDAMKDAIDQGDEFLVKVLQARKAMDELNSEIE